MTKPNIPPTLQQLTVPIDTLKHYGKNPRRGDVDLIAQSLERNGQYRPVTVRTGTNEILAGNHTVKAAKQLGWEVIAATFVDVDDLQAKRIVLIDNRANDMATTDSTVLADLLQELGVPELPGTGYSEHDLKRLLPKETDGWTDFTPPQAVVSYRIVFDNEAQLNAWHEYLKYLKNTVPGKTIGERLTHHLEQITR